MATYTTNLNLKKPEGTESQQIADINDNMDTIDAFVGLQNQTRKIISDPDLLDVSLEPGFYYGNTCTNYPSEASSTSGYVDIIVRKGYASTIRIVRFQPYNSNIVYQNMRQNSSSWTGWDYFFTKGKASASDNLTITRVSNSYVDATNIGRCAAVKKNGILSLRININPGTASATSDFVEIATISGWVATLECLVNVPPQNGSSKVMNIQVTYDGHVKVYGANGFDNSFYRTQITVPMANGYV